MNDRKVQLVIAPTYQTFCYWCAENGYQPTSPMVRFIPHGCSKLAGYRDGLHFELVLVNHGISPHMTHREMTQFALINADVRLLRETTNIEVREEVV